MSLSNREKASWQFLAKLCSKVSALQGVVWDRRFHTLSEAFLLEQRAICIQDENIEGWPAIAGELDNPTQQVAHGACRVGVVSELYPPLCRACWPFPAAAVVELAGNGCGLVLVHVLRRLFGSLRNL